MPDAGIPMPGSATGRVTQLFVHQDRTKIRLEIPVEIRPLDDYFILQTSHPNYNALYSLALAAAVNGYNLEIWPRGRVVPGEEAIIENMVVDW